MSILNSIFGWLGISSSRRYEGGGGTGSYGNTAYGAHHAQRGHQRKRARSSPDIRRPSATANSSPTNQKYRERSHSENHVNPFDLEAQRLEARKTHAKMEAARQAEHEKYVAGKQLEARRSEAREAKKHKAAKVQARALANQEAPILPMDDSLREEDDDEPGWNDSVSQIHVEHRYRHMPQGVRKGFENLDTQGGELMHMPSNVPAPYNLHHRKPLAVSGMPVAASTVTARSDHSSTVRRKPLRIMGAPDPAKKVVCHADAVSGGLGVIHQMPWYPGPEPMSKALVLRSNSGIKKRSTPASVVSKAYSSSSSNVSSQTPSLTSSASSKSSEASLRTIGGGHPGVLLTTAYGNNGLNGRKAIGWPSEAGDKAMVRFDGPRVVEIA